MNKSPLTPDPDFPGALHGLILGGGRSRRMGEDKATLSYHGRPQLEILWEMLDGFCARTFISIRPDQGREPAFSGYPQLVDLFPGEGPLGALVSAQKQCPGAAWLVVACDLPFLAKADIAHLIHNRDTKYKGVAYLSAHDGRVEPLCALYEPQGAEELARIFSGGMRCARRGLEALSPKTLALLSPQALDNANTPADRQEALEKLSGKTIPGENAAQARLPVRVFLHAQLREKLGDSVEMLLDLPNEEQAVLRQIGLRFPDLAPLLLRCRIAVDDAYLLPGESIGKITRLDIIAPVSGG